MDKKTKYTLLGVLIILGVIYFFYISNLRYNATKIENNMISQYLIKDSNGLYLKNKNLIVKNYSGIKNKVPVKDVIGILEIPSINLEAPILDGTNFENLRYAVTYFNDTVLPGDSGNCAFAANDSFSMNIFKDLDKVKIGNEIDLKFKGNEYKYKITAIKQEDSTPITAIEESNKKSITLVEYSNNTNEILQVQGIEIT
ncbi:MAG: sortase [Sarcina sp.]